MMVDNKMEGWIPNHASEDRRCYWFRSRSIFDSGIRCGADIAKALALGARVVLIGRPYVYGLAFGGENGVSHVLRTLLGELDLTLHLPGILSVSKDILSRACLAHDM
jgi:lactate 2-monooxygenase